MKGRKNISRAFMIGLGVLALGLGVWRLTQMNRSRGGTVDTTLADFGPVPDFSLTERSGKTVTLSDLKGKPWLGNFIFTRCGGPCPLLSMRTSELQAEYLPKTELTLVSFTVDPEYDTPAVLTAYAQRYSADPERWLFLTGASRKIYELVRDGFHLAVEKNQDPKQKPGEQVNHSLSFVLVDSTGHIRGYYAGNDLASMKRLRRDLDTLLNV